MPFIADFTVWVFLNFGGRTLTYDWLHPYHVETGG